MTVVVRVQDSRHLNSAVTHYQDYTLFRDEERFGRAGEGHSLALWGASGPSCDPGIGAAVRGWDYSQLPREAGAGAAIRSGAIQELGLPSEVGKSRGWGCRQGLGLPSGTGAAVRGWGSSQVPGEGVANAAIRSRVVQGLGLLSGARATVSFEGRWGLGLQEERRSPKGSQLPAPLAAPSQSPNLALEQQPPS